MYFPDLRHVARIGIFFAVLTGFASLAVAQNKLGRKLGGTFRGNDAIAALGMDLPAVANAHGLSTSDLAQLFRAQKDLAVDPDGALFFVCEGLALPAGIASNSAFSPETAVAQAASGDNIDVFQLHSFPGSTRVIYLDFNGHTTSGTQWNATFTGGASIGSQPFDLDGNPSGFNTTEQAIIRGIWKRVAEDYAPFAIDVTTEDPGVEALRRSNSSDSAYGVRVVISPTNWYNSGAGGVAYIGSFNWNSDTPCFVFTAQLANGEKYIAEAVAHEAGHTVGLHHDGATGSGATEYYAGHGNWAPIMGNSYYKSVTQFSRGEYAGANNLQDDVAVIASFAPAAADDHGDTMGTASLLSGPNVADGGTIERSSDADMFRFNIGSGAVALVVEGSITEPNLDIKAELLNSAGQSIQVSDPAGLKASISAVLSAGTYYLRVSAVGVGNPLNTGYSTYGSLGNYVITGSLAGISPPPPPPPGSVAAVAGDARVDLTWSAVTSASSYIVKRSLTSGGPYTVIGSAFTSTTFSDTGLENGTRYHYVIGAANADGESGNSQEVNATPSGQQVSTGTAYVTNVSLGSLRNDYGGWVGMQIVVGGSPITISHLARMVVAGNSSAHTVKLVRASDGADVPGGATTILTSGKPAGQFEYGALSAPVTLPAGGTFYLVSQETAGGDLWHEYNTQIVTTSAAATNGVVWGAGSSPWNTYGISNRSYVPLSFKYSTGAPVGGDTAYVTNASLGSLRNDYSGWVGMRIVVGSSPITISQLARMVAPGNTGAHPVKLVRASDGADVAGGGTTISTSGKPAGQFEYGTLSTPVTLPAGGTFYLLSQETAGGDQWHEYDTQLSTTSAAATDGIAWGVGGPSWNTYSISNRSYVPLNFRYSAAGPAGGTAYVIDASLGSLRNDYSGWVGMRIVVGSSPITITHLARIVVAGNAGAHTVKLVRASDGADVAGGATTISTSGKPAGQFEYGTLGAPVTLPAGGTFYLLSQETVGGDQWYEYDTQLITTAAAAINGIAWGVGGPSWNTYDISNRSYVPLNFKYGSL